MKLPERGAHRAPVKFASLVFFEKFNGASRDQLSVIRCAHSAESIAHGAERIGHSAERMAQSVKGKIQKTKLIGYRVRQRARRMA